MKGAWANIEWMDDAPPMRVYISFGTYNGIDADEFGVEDDDIFYYLSGETMENLMVANPHADFRVIDYELVPK